MYTDYIEEENKNDDNNIEYYEDNGENDNKNKKIIFFALLLCVVIILFIVIAKSCSKNNNNGKNQVNSDITIAINRNNITLEVDDEFQLNAQVLNADTSNPIVAWYSEDSSIVSVNDDGSVKALKEGETKIIATYKARNDDIYNSECKIIVTSEIRPLENISIEQDNFTLKKGTGIILQIILEPNDAKATNLSFVSDNPNVATVSVDGYVSAIDVGTTTITVKNSDGLISDSVTVTVVNDGPTKILPTDLKIYGLSQELSVGGTAELRTDIIPSNSTDRTLTWISTDTSIATVENGVITGKKAGKCKIVVSTSNNISREYEITVHQNQINVTGINITSGTNLEINPGWTGRIYYEIAPSNATNKKVKFYSNNISVVNVLSNGVFSAIGSGNAVITVTTEDGKHQAIVNIVVKEVGSQENSTSTSSSSSSGSNTSSSSSSSSSSNSSSGSSSSNSSSGSSSSNSSSSSSESATCTAYGMIQASNNCRDYGTVISTNSFSNAKPYTIASITPSIDITSIDKCIESFTYKVYYGATESTISSVSVSSGNITKSGQSIKLTKGDGYYKIAIIGTPKSGNKLTKHYYAIVKRSSEKPTLKLSQKFYYPNVVIKQAGISFEASSSIGLKEIKYGSSYSQTVTFFNNTIPTNSVSRYNVTHTFNGIEEKNGRLPTYCAIAYDINGSQSNMACITIK